jgi:MYXO-CTERM domain-containing protein
MRLPLLLAGCAAMGSLLVASRSASARDCQYYSGNGPGVYNLQNGLTEQYAQHVDQAGIGGLRMGFRIDTQTTWDQALFDQYDAYMAVAREHGLDVMGIVLYESTTGGQADWNSGYDSTGMSPYVQTFVDTAKLLMTRYGDQVKYWEIWNEPNAWTNSNYANDPTNAGGTYILPLVYSKMLAEVYVQANSVITSKGLHLIAGGLFAHDIGGSFSPATDYAQQVYQLGPWDWMQANYGRRYPWDGFGYHIYIDQGGATSSAHILQYVDAIQQLKVNETDYVPLWITEFGWQSPMPLSDAQQAANLDTALTTFESRGDVARTFVFKVDDYASWGIFDGSWNAKPAVATYTTHDMGCTHLPKEPLDAGAEGGGTTGKDAGTRGDAGGGGGVRDAGGASGDAARGGGGGVGDASEPGVDASGAADDGGGNGATGGTGSSSGCGCRTTRADGSGVGLGAFAIAVAAAAMRRRRS